MKLNPDFKLREVVGETIIVNQGTPEVDLTRVISLNASAKLLYERLSGQDFTLAQAAQVLTDTYRITEQQALQDAATWVDAMKKCHVLQD